MLDAPCRLMTCDTHDPQNFSTSRDKVRKTSGNQIPCKFWIAVKNEDKKPKAQVLLFQVKRAMSCVGGSSSRRRRRLSFIRLSFGGDICVDQFISNCVPHHAKPKGTVRPRQVEGGTESRQKQPQEILMVIGWWDHTGEA